MNVIMEPSFIFGIVVTIIALGISFAAFKPNKTEVSAIKNWLEWSGSWGIWAETEFFEKGI